MGSVSEGSKEERFQFITDNQDDFGIRYLCRKLGVSPSGFYKRLKRAPSARIAENAKLTTLIKAIFNEHDGNYGSPRVHRELLLRGVRVNRKRVERIMRIERLVGKSAKRYRRKSLPGNSCIKVDNLRINEPAPASTDQQWVGDVTYLKLNGKWVYLSVIMDVYSRKIIGWSLGPNRTSELTKQSLRMALKSRQLKDGLIFHSDKGSEYGAHDFQSLLRRAGIRPSMNRPKTMTDNIHIESFFRTFKTESFHGEVFEDQDHLFEVTKWYLEEYYNRKRMHTSLGFKSPSEYEKMAA